MRRLRGRGARRLRPQTPRRPAGGAGGRRARARWRRSPPRARFVRPYPRVALGGVVAVVAVSYAIWTPYQAQHLEEYRDDAVFLCVAESKVPPGEPLFVQWDWIGPLETFWVLYHTHRPGVLIRDPWQAADRVARQRARLYPRPANGCADPGHGRHPRAVILESLHTRARKTPATAVCSSS